DPLDYTTLGQVQFLYAPHDALVKPMPGNFFTPSLAESYEIAPDFKSATFKLRPGIKFHDGTPVTSEDVKFTYENYRGTNAKSIRFRRFRQFNSTSFRRIRSSNLLRPNRPIIFLTSRVKRKRRVLCTISGCARP